MSNKRIAHGGDIYRLHREYDIPIENIFDFSGNINPTPIDEGLKNYVYQHFDEITHYPDLFYTDLRAAIGEYLHISPELIMVGNGATEMIYRMIKSLSGKKALIPSPTYGEYQRAIRMEGGSVEISRIKEENDFMIDPYQIIEEIRTKEIDFLVLCNPNNPTGRTMKRIDLTEILEFCRKKKIPVMLDETYIEFAPDFENSTMVRELMSYPNVVVIRGFTKFFSVPGIRLGYSVSHPQWIDKFSEYQEAWSVNSFADMVGRYMLRDQDFIHRSQKWIQDERTYLWEGLNGFPELYVYPSESNFILARIKEKAITAAEIAKALEKKGMLIRDASSFDFLDERFVRFAVNDHDKNRKLLEAVKSILAE